MRFLDVVGVVSPVVLFIEGLGDLFAGLLASGLGDLFQLALDTSCHLLVNECQQCLPICWGFLVNLHGSHFGGLGGECLLLQFLERMDLLVGAVLLLVLADGGLEDIHEELLELGKVLDGGLSWGLLELLLLLVVGVELGLVLLLGLGVLSKGLLMGSLLFSVGLQVHLVVRQLHLVGSNPLFVFCHFGKCSLPSLFRAHLAISHEAGEVYLSGLAVGEPL